MTQFGTSMNLAKERGHRARRGILFGTEERRGEILV